jgi:hypothetical protein
LRRVRLFGVHKQDDMEVAPALADDVSLLIDVNPQACRNSDCLLTLGA